MDEIDRKILNILQMDFPLAPAPFDEIGRQVGLAPAEVIERVRCLKDSGVIRQISAIFDSQSLGYTGSLVAAKVDPEKLDAVAAIVNRSPEVTHNYARDHEYNLWFTVTVPPGRQVEEEVARIASEAGIENYLVLPALQVFKISFQLDMTGDTSDTAAQLSDEDLAPAPVKATPSAQDIALVRALQKDLPLTEHPFAGAAVSLGISEDQLVRAAQELQARGLMRRFAAVLRHRHAGYSANGMGVWIVPEGEVERAGRIMASFREVSHCYQRPSYPDWPYNLFTMIHGVSREDCEGVARRIAEKVGIADYRLLYSLKEYKKVRVKYFEEYTS
jgi:siroheme decarboxylase